jgi:hypothetical protein
MRPTTASGGGWPWSLPLHLPPRAAVNSAPRTISRVVVVGFAGNLATANETGSFRCYPADVAHPKAVGTSY